MTSMKELRRKSLLLTGYLEYLIRHHYSEDAARPDRPHVCILTPSDPEQRGCQLSLRFSINICAVYRELERRGVAVSRRAAACPGRPRSRLNVRCVAPVRHAGAAGPAGGAGATLQLLQRRPPLRHHAGAGAGRLPGPAPGPLLKIGMVTGATVGMHADL